VILIIPQEENPSDICFTAKFSLPDNFLPNHVAEIVVKPLKSLSGIAASNLCNFQTEPS
jgi:hypothetical protein